MSYGQGEPRVYLLNIETGQREIVGNFPGMTFAPRFSPDGQRVIMSLQQGGNANLFVMDLRSKQTTRLTDTPAIDTAPCLFAGRPRRSASRCDRGGSQQIYVMAASGGRGAAHQLRRGPPFDAGLVAARRLHRLHRPRGRQFAIGVHQAGRLRRAHPDRGFPQRGPDLRAEWAGDDVLPRSRRPGPSLYTIDITGRNELKVRRRASPRIRPGRRCCPERSHCLPTSALFSPRS